MRKEAPLNQSDTQTSWWAGRLTGSGPGIAAVCEEWAEVSDYAPQPGDTSALLVPLAFEPDGR